MLDTLFIEDAGGFPDRESVARILDRVWSRGHAMGHDRGGLRRHPYLRSDGLSLGATRRPAGATEVLRR